MDFTRLRFVSERADNSETLVSIEIPEKPGNLVKLNIYSNIATSAKDHTLHLKIHE